MFDPKKELFVVLAYLDIEYTLQIRAKYDSDYNMAVTLQGEFVVSVFYSVLQYFSSFYQYFCSI